MVASSFTSVTVGSPAGTVAPATQLVAGGGPTVLVFNTSSSVTVYLTDTNDSMSTDAGTFRVTPLGPMGSVVFNGTVDVFAVCALGQTCVLNLYPSAISFNPAGFTAVPLASASGHVLPGLTIDLVSMLNVSAFASYDITLYMHNVLQNNVGSLLTAPIVLTWFDDINSGTPIYVEQWNPWISNTPYAPAVPGIVCGSAPMHGNYLTMSCTNIGAVDFQFDFMNFYGSGRSRSASSWRQQPPNMSTNGIGNWAGRNYNQTYDNILGLFDGQVPAALSTTWIPFGLGAGPATFKIETGAGNNTNIVLAVADPVDVQSGTVAPGNAQPHLTEYPGGANNSLDQVTLPRTPTYVVYQQSAAPSGVSMSLVLDNND